MLYAVATVILAVWVVGLATGYFVSDVAHVLLFLALVLVVTQFLSGPRTV